MIDRMKKLYSIVGMWIVSAFCLLSAQSRVYSSVENVHSHNDYLQNVPFYTAYSARCASIEADVFLVDGELYVAHKENEINKKNNEIKNKKTEEVKAISPEYYINSIMSYEF